MAIDLNEIYREIGPTLRERARRALADHPDADLAAIMLDAPTAIERGIVTEEEFGDGDRSVGVVRILPRSQVIEAFGDEPAIREFVVRTPGQLPVIVRNGGEVVVAAMSIADE